MITFKANLINYQTIKKQVDKNTLENHRASFVQLQSDNKNDAKVLEKISTNKDWASFYGDSIRLFFNNNEPNAFTYAITNQKDDFENLNHKDILALACIKKIDPRCLILEYLQVDPQNNYSATNPLFKNIGTAMINSLEKIFSGQEMVLIPRNEAVPFYEKLGFSVNIFGLFSKKL